MPEDIKSRIAAGETTSQVTVEVRVIAAGGKFLGNDIGGAQVTVRDAVTGELVATGRVAGGSGVTSEIMGQPRTWGTPVPVDQSSVFSFQVPVNEPRLLDITAYGPIGSLASARTASVQQWVLPWQNLVGPAGVQVVIPGQLVQIQAPATHTQLQKPGQVQILANLAMMCGCPITSSPPWPSSAFNVWGFVYLLNGQAPPQFYDQFYLYPTGIPSQFQGSWVMQTAGFYELVVGIQQNGTSNVGVDRVTVFCPPPSDA
jgi:hypothetical protein